MQDTTSASDIERELLRRRAAVAAEWADLDAVVLIGAGEPVGRPGRDDVTYRFEAHSEYYYLTDRDRPGGVLAFDPDEGWVDFVAPITAGDRDKAWAQLGTRCEVCRLYLDQRNPQPARYSRF